MITFNHYNLNKKTVPITEKNLKEKCNPPLGCVNIATIYSVYRFSFL